jgi:hypothetical protein
LERKGALSYLALASMDSDRALDTLGVTRGASAEELRRAYLRHIKQHPPERDPEGFQRAREAYELLKGAPWLFTSRPSKASIKTADAEGETPPLAVGRPAFTVLVAATSPAPPESAEPEARVVVGERERQQNDVEPSDADHDEAELVDRMLAVPALPDPLEQRLAELTETMRRRQYSRSAKLLRKLYDLPGIDPDRLPPLNAAIELLFRVSERGLPKRATTLRAALEAHVERTGVGMRAGLAAKLKLHKEVTAIAGVNAVVAQSLAKAVRRGDFAVAAGDVLAACAARGRPFQSFMEKRAPGCWSGVAPHLPNREATARTWWWSSASGIQAAIFIAFVMFRVACPSAPDVATSPAMTNERVADGPPEPSSPSSAAVQLTVPTRSEAPSASDGTWAAVEAALAYTDCQRALEQWRSFRRGPVVSGPTTSKHSVRPPIDPAQLGQVVRVCPELEPILE